MIQSIANELAAAHHGTHVGILESIQAFVVSMSEKDARALAEDPRVESVEADVVAHLAQWFAHCPQHSDVSSRSSLAVHSESFSAVVDPAAVGKQGVQMQKRIVSVVALLTATVIAAAGLAPLSIKTGAWQVTMTSSINGMPPRTTSYTSCIRSEDLTKYPFTDPKANCSWKVLSSTGSTMQANGTCTPPNMGPLQFVMQLTAIDAEHVQGMGQLTATSPNGAISGNYSGSGKWIGAQCPATQ